MGLIESTEGWNNDIQDDMRDDTNMVYTGLRSYSSSENLSRPDIPLYTYNRNLSVISNKKINNQCVYKENFVELVKKYENSKNQDTKDTIIKTMLLLADVPSKCNTNYIDKKGITLLMALICCKLSDVIFKLLPYIEESDIEMFVGDISFRPYNPYKNTELMIAIRKRLNNVAIEILKFPSVCKIADINTFGDTALIIAVKIQSSDVIREILKYCDKFDVNHCNNAGETALSIAKKNNLDIVSDIEKCVYIS